MLNLIITYIWFGAMIPENNLLRLQNITNPIRILLNPPNNYTYKLEIQKADRYRLEFLLNGGVYCDFDTFYYYDCLMGMLEKFHGEMLTMGYGEDQGWKVMVPNNFFYVPIGESALIKDMLEKQGKDCQKDIAHCNGGIMLQNYRNRITIQNMDACVGHNFEYSWGPRNSFGIFDREITKKMSWWQLKQMTKNKQLFWKRRMDRYVAEEQRTQKRLKLKPKRFTVVQNDQNIQLDKQNSELKQQIMIEKIIIATAFIIAIVLTAGIVYGEILRQRKRQKLRSSPPTFQEEVEITI